MVYWFLIFSLTSSSFLAAFKSYETVRIPFQVDEDSKEITERISLDYQFFSVLHDKNIGVNITIHSNAPIKLSVSMCGDEILETLGSVQNVTFILNRDWVETLSDDHIKTCDRSAKYLMDFKIRCSGSCQGKMHFTIVNIEPESFELEEARSNPSEGVIPFQTSGNNIPASVTSNIGFVIDAVYQNPRLRLNLEIEYTINYTLAIGKCNLIFLRKKLTGALTKFHLNWEQIKAFRLSKNTQCPDDLKDTINYIMMSEEEGHGLLTFSMLKHPETLPNHPANKYEMVQTAHQIKKKTLKTNFGVFPVPISIVVVFTFLQYV